MRHNQMSISLAPTERDCRNSELNFEVFSKAAKYNNNNTEDEDSNEIDIDPPVQLICGQDKLSCCSSKLHGAIFVLSIILTLFYLMTTACAWVLYLIVVGVERDSRKFLLCLALSVSFRLISAIFLLVGSLTRTNGWILIHILASIASLGLFLTATLLHRPLIALSSIGLISADLILLFLLFRFMDENHHYKSILADKKQKYNQAIRKLIQQAENAQDEEEETPVPESEGSKGNPKAKQNWKRIVHMSQFDGGQKDLQNAVQKLKDLKTLPAKEKSASIKMKMSGNNKAKRPPTSA